MEFIQIEVTKREETGKGPIGRLRRAGSTPGNLYGLGRPNLHLSLPTVELARFIDSRSHLVELKMGSEVRPAIMRELQIDALTDEILHVDFHRVEEGAEIEDHVRIVFKGTAVGATTGGVFQPLEEALLISSTPKNIPAEFLLDISALELGDSIHASDVELPEGVTLLSPLDLLLAHVVAPKLTAEDEEEEVEGAAEGEAPDAEEGGDA